MSQGYGKTVPCALKLHEATQMFMMVDNVREVTSKKSCKYDGYGSFDHFLFLFCYMCANVCVCVCVCGCLIVCWFLLCVCVFLLCLLVAFLLLFCFRLFAWFCPCFVGVCEWMCVCSAPVYYVPWQRLSPALCVPFQWLSAAKCASCQWLSPASKFHVSDCHQLVSSMSAIVISL